MKGNQTIEAWSDMKAITDYLGVSCEMVLQWINKRDVPAHKVGQRWKFKMSELMTG